MPASVPGPVLAAVSVDVPALSSPPSVTDSLDEDTPVLTSSMPPKKLRSLSSCEGSRAAVISSAGSSVGVTSSGSVSGDSVSGASGCSVSSGIASSDSAAVSGITSGSTNSATGDGGGAVTAVSGVARAEAAGAGSLVVLFSSAGRTSDCSVMGSGGGSITSSSMGESSASVVRCQMPRELRPKAIACKPTELKRPNSKSFRSPTCSRSCCSTQRFERLMKI